VRRVVDLEHRHRRLVRGLEAVHPDDHLPPRVDPRLRARGGLLDAELGHASLDRLDHPAQRLDLVDVRHRASREIVREALDVVAAAPRVDRADRARLVLQLQLRVSRDARREVSG
jgi:hypothetical protein